MIFIASTIFLALSLKPSYSVKGEEFYLFCTYSGSDEQEAISMSTITQELGGVGEILEYNDNINVIACVYTTIEDANSVAEKNDGVVITVSLPTVTSNDKNYVSEISKTYKFVADKVNKLTSAFIQLEKGNENERVVEKLLNDFENEVLNGNGEFYIQLSSQINPQLPIKDKCKMYCVKMVVYCLDMLNNV